MKPSFHEKLIQTEKHIIVVDLCPVTFKSFVIQWSAKIAGRRPQLKPLYSSVSIVDFEQVNIGWDYFYYFINFQVTH